MNLPSKTYATLPMSFDARCREPTLCSEDFTPSSVFGTGPHLEKQPWVMASMLKQMAYTHM